MAFPASAAQILLAQIGWIEGGGFAAAAAVIGYLGWRLGDARREYVEQLADQARQVDDAQEAATQARREKDVLAGENKTKSEMLATLSREIRAHLNGVIGSADLMLGAALPAPQRDRLATLRASAEALVQSLNDVLDYASMEVGQIRIANAVFDLRQPIAEVADVLAPLAALKGVGLIVIVSPDVPLLVSGDASRLRQILFNLTANAVKFTDAGRVVVRVEPSTGVPTRVKAGVTWLQFSVSDTSAGIPDDLRATIFDRPGDTASASPRKLSGSGLELAISKRLVELMDGQIGSRSVPESGSEFWLTLPFVADRIQSSPIFTAADRLHVVVLDDVAAMRLAALAVLTRIGAGRDATDNVADAAMLLHDAVEAEARDVLLLVGETLLKTKGAELTRVLTEDPTLRMTRVVVMARDPDAAAASVGELPLAAVVRTPLVWTDPLAEALRKMPGATVGRGTGSRAPFEKSTVVPPTRRGPKVMVVDDDAISRSVSSQLLELIGCDVEVALSGAEALERAQASPYELIFMDCQMPEMDGFMATERIRTALGTKTPPVIAITANTTVRDREKCFAVGMCDFIGKPVTKSELARVVRRWAPAALRAPK
jgi:two-component system sensor histidine kinase/response regulator